VWSFIYKEHLPLSAMQGIKEVGVSKLKLEISSVSPTRKQKSVFKKSAQPLDI